MVCLIVPKTQETDIVNIVRVLMSSGSECSQPNSLLLTIDSWHSSAYPHTTSQSILFYTKTLSLMKQFKGGGLYCYVWFFYITNILHTLISCKIKISKTTQPRDGNGEWASGIPTLRVLWAGIFPLQGQGRGWKSPCQIREHVD